MSPVAHLQYGWWFAHWGEFNRRERTAIALAGAAADLDGLGFLGGTDTYYRYHHILFHNLGATLAVVLLAGVLFWRRSRVWLLVIFAYAMHVVEDYVTVGWNQHPWQPFSASAVNLADRLPNWLVQGVFQTAAMLFILAVTIRIYQRHGRTPLEMLSPALDRLVVNYAVLPWRTRCAHCAAPAHFRCDGCGSAACGAHVRVARLSVCCAACGAEGSKEVES